MAQTVTGFYPFQDSKNILLVKDDVGRSKPTINKLPPIEFTYGKKALSKEEGVSQITRQWKFHEQTRPGIPIRDFKQLNKIGISQGVYRSKDLTLFRSNTDARVKIQHGKNQVPIYLPEDNFRYGIKNKPSTPMQQVMGNVYGIKAQNEAKQFYEFQKQTGSLNRRPQLIPKGTKAQVLQYSYQKQLQQQKAYEENHKNNHFKLSKFKSVSPKVSNRYFVSKNKQVQQKEQQSVNQNQQQEQKQQEQNVQQQQQVEDQQQQEQSQ